MRLRYSRWLHGALFVALAVAFGFMAAVMQIGNSINAHYFPDDADQIHWWPVWALAALGGLCVGEAIFGVIWRRHQKRRNEEAA